MSQVTFVGQVFPPSATVQGFGDAEMVAEAALPTHLPLLGFHELPAVQLAVAASVSSIVPSPFLRSNTVCG